MQGLVCQQCLRPNACIPSSASVSQRPQKRHSSSKTRLSPTTSLDRKCFARAAEADDRLVGEQEVLWRSVSKSLITVGRQGVGAGHCSSLTELLKSHTLVKVKVQRTSDIDAVIQEFIRASNAVHLQTKGNTVLFARSLCIVASLDEAELLEIAHEGLDRLEKQKKRRQEEQQIKEIPPSGVQLPVSVKKLLKSMEEQQMLCSITFDTKTKLLLSQLSEESQLEILSSINRKELTKIRNKSAWLTSRIKIHQKALGSSY